MERILLIWLGPDGTQRISYELMAGDLAEASRIFAEMAEKMKKLGPNSPVDARKEQG